FYGCQCHAYVVVAECILVVGSGFEDVFTGCVSSKSEGRIAVFNLSVDHAKGRGESCIDLFHLYHGTGGIRFATFHVCVPLFYAWLWFGRIPRTHSSVPVYRY